MATDLYRIFVYDGFLSIRIAFNVIDVPAKGLPNKIERLSPRLCLVIPGGLEVIDVGVEVIFQDFDAIGCSHCVPR